MSDREVRDELERVQNALTRSENELNRLHEELRKALTQSDEELSSVRSANVLLQTERDQLRYELSLCRTGLHAVRPSPKPRTDLAVEGIRGKVGGLLGPGDGRRLYQAVSKFASALGPGRILNISLSEDGGDTLALVWYFRDAPAAPESEYELRFEIVTSTAFTRWKTSLAEAREKAMAIPPNRLFGITHSADDSAGEIVIWYWTKRVRESAAAAE